MNENITYGDILFYLEYIQNRYTGKGIPIMEINQDGSGSIEDSLLTDVSVSWSNAEQLSKLINEAKEAEASSSE